MTTEKLQNGHANGHLPNSKKVTLDPVKALAAKLTNGTSIPLASVIANASAHGNGGGSLLKLNRTTLIIGLVGFAIFACLYLYNRSGPSVDYKLYYTLLRSVPTADTCHIPNPDPWDPSIQKYLEKPEPLVCKKLQGQFTQLDKDGWLRLDRDKVKEEGYSGLNCQYRCFDRVEGVDDLTLNYNAWTVFSDKVKLDCEFVEVDCSRSFPAISVYSNLHNQIVVNQTRLAELDKMDSGRKSLGSGSDESLDSGGNKHPSVLVFILDSVSRSNFIRNLPKTKKVLENELGSVLFDGFTKVGDNSFPNACAFLTGKISKMAGHVSELPDDMTDSFFDDWPIVWKDFSQAGYLTYYAEDYPNYNLFQYLSNGFKKKPVDHYFRPYWVQLWGTFLHRRSTHLCYGNTPKLHLQLNYLEQYLTKYRDRTKFSFQWQTELGHDWLNQVALGDDDLSEFFRRIKPVLNDTIVFVYSDHGHRFDAIRESVIGRIEERMPFFTVAIPPWMREKYPKIQENLRNNSKLLSSPFDVYITFRDIIASGQNWSDLDKQKDWTGVSKRGQSLFRPITAKRTCEEAGIPEEFCICQQETMVNVTDPKVIQAANELILHINKMLKDYPKECAPLYLKGIRNAQTFLPNLKMVLDPKVSIFYGGQSPTGFYVNYRVAIEADPSDGLFEGTLRNRVHDNTFQVVGDVNRINKYGNQSICINSAILRKYCYCVV